MPETSKARAMVLERPGSRLILKEVSAPAPGPDQVPLKVHACGICRTDLHLKPLRFGSDYGLPSRQTLPCIPDGRFCFWVAGADR